MANDEKLVAALALIAGVAIGANWDKIKKTLEPLVASLTDQTSKITEKGAMLLAKQKENAEDSIAAAKIAAAKQNLQSGKGKLSNEIVIKTKETVKSKVAMLLAEQKENAEDSIAAAKIAAAKQNLQSGNRKLSYNVKRKKTVKKKKNFTSKKKGTKKIKK